MVRRRSEAVQVFEATPTHGAKGPMEGCDEVLRRLVEAHCPPPVGPFVTKEGESLDHLIHQRRAAPASFPDGRW